MAEAISNDNRVYYATPPEIGALNAAVPKEVVATAVHRSTTVSATDTMASVVADDQTR